jgi:hypothetical protein
LTEEPADNGACDSDQCGDDESAGLLAGQDEFRERARD